VTGGGPQAARCQLAEPGIPDDHYRSAPLIDLRFAAGHGENGLAVAIVRLWHRVVQQRVYTLSPWSENAVGPAKLRAGVRARATVGQPLGGWCESAGGGVDAILDNGVKRAGP
jgi:hypothetical protein